LRRAWYVRGGLASLVLGSALLVAPGAQADEERRDCRFVLTVAAGAQYGIYGAGGEYGCARLAGYLGGGPFGATAGLRLFSANGEGGFLSLGSGVLLIPDDPGTNVYYVLLDAIGGVRLRWRSLAVQFGIGALVMHQLSSGPRSTVRTGLVLAPDAQLGVSIVFD